MNRIASFTIIGRSQQSPLFRRSCLRVVFVCCLVTSVLFAHSLFAGPTINTSPDWVVKTTAGNEISLRQELQQGKQVVLVFWATWCRHCKELLPQLQNLYQQKRGGSLTFIMMNIWQEGRNAAPQALLSELGVDIPMSVHADAIAQKYQVRSTPGIFLIGEDFSILYRSRPGESPEHMLEQLKQKI